MSRGKLDSAAPRRSASGGSQPALPVTPGTVLAGKYRVEGVLGRGGMGTVVAARHEVLDQNVAIKLLHRADEHDRASEARFAREGRAAAKLKSEHAARVLDVGALDDGTPYLVMELLRGRDLAGEIRARGAIPPTEAVDWVLEALDAISEAHALGFVHRDLKPSNLFLAKRPNGPPRVKVLDFGIAKAEAGGDETLTATGAMMGSPAYMSPEQIRSTRSVDPRSDLWSVGVILYELLTGETPFCGDGRAGTLAAVLQDDPAPIRSRAPNVPEELEKVVSRCLERDRERRFQHAAELVAALAPFASAHGRAVAETVSRKRGGLPLAPSLAAGSHAGSAPPRVTPSAAPAASWRWALPAGLAALVAAIGATWGLVRAPAPSGEALPPPSALPLPPTTALRADDGEPVAVAGRATTATTPPSQPAPPPAQPVPPAQPEAVTSATAAPIASAAPARLGSTARPAPRGPAAPTPPATTPPATTPPATTPPATTPPASPAGILDQRE